MLIEREKEIERLREIEKECQLRRERETERDERERAMTERLRDLSLQLEERSLLYKPERSHFTSPGQCIHALESLECGRALVQCWKEELEREKERDREESTLCVICCERKKCVALLPCGHLCLCEEDGRRLLDRERESESDESSDSDSSDDDEEEDEEREKTCPVCREVITGSVKVYL